MDEHDAIYQQIRPPRPKPGKQPVAAADVTAVGSHVRSLSPWEEQQPLYPYLNLPLLSHHQEATQGPLWKDLSMVFGGESLATELPAMLGRQELAEGLWHGSKNPLSLLLTGPGMAKEVGARLLADELGQAVLRTTPQVSKAAQFSEYNPYLFKVKMDPEKMKGMLNLADPRNILDYQRAVNRMSRLQAQTPTRTPFDEIYQSVFPRQAEATRAIAEQYPAVDARYASEALKELRTRRHGTLSNLRSNRYSSISQYPSMDLHQAASEQQLAIQDPNVVHQLDLHYLDRENLQTGPQPIFRAFLEKGRPYRIEHLPENVPSGGIPGHMEFVQKVLERAKNLGFEQIKPGILEKKP
jgi:hypothetical protein